jgi:biopolymer transport protein ExbB
MKNKTVLLSLLVLAFLACSGVAQLVFSQPQKPLTEEAPTPQQPVDSAAARAVNPAAGGLRAASATPAIRGGGLAEWFARGGLFMWPILICSIVASIFIIERAYTLVRARTNTRALMTDILTAVRRDGVSAAERVCEQTRGPIASIIHSGLRQASKGPEAVEKAIETAGAVEMSFLERGLIWLATISTVAPLLGFLGTVSGMIHAFDAIAAADQVSAKLVAGGISEALITTEAGLIVAIPASLAHNLFLSLIDRFVVEMEESSSELVNTIVEVR